MRCLVLASLLVAGAARADDLVVAPGFPIRLQDWSVGYRHEELTDLSLDGFALRGVFAVPGLMLEGEGMMSGAWGLRNDNTVGHLQIATGLRLVFNKPGIWRPFLVAAPMVQVTRDGSDDAYAIGGAGGAGMDVIPIGPLLLSADVRAGQTWDFKASAWSGWQLLVTISIGGHAEP
jgi:hypothetical protein